MRIYKPAYTKPLPADAKIKRDKDGAYVALIDREGQSKKCRVIETDKGKRMSVESSYYTIVFRDHAGIERRLQGYREKASTEALAEKIGQLVYRRERSESLPADLQQWADELPEAIHKELAGFGLVKARRAAVSQDLEEMLAQFEQHLTLKKQRSAGYIAERVKKLRGMFTACGFKMFADIDDVAIEAYLLELRKDRTIIVDGEEKLKRGLSIRTLNDYLGAAQQFCRFAVRKLKVAKSSPLDCIERFGGEAADRRRVRRALTQAEIEKLLTTTAKSEAIRFGMDGKERALLYRFALMTGLRANEIRTLRAEHLDFDHPDGPVVWIEAAYSKHRERDILPLHHSLVPELKHFIQERGKLPATKLFGGYYRQLTDKPGVVLQEDLTEAEIEQKTVAGSVDFHALRHTFISSLKAVSARTAQGLARHKSSSMTDHYTHRALAEQRAALEQVNAFGLAG